MRKRAPPTSSTAVGPPIKRTATSRAASSFAAAALVSGRGGAQPAITRVSIADTSFDMTGLFMP